MKVILNKEEVEFEGITVADMLRSLDISSEGIAIAVGTWIVSRAKHEIFELTEGDTVTIITATHGG